jgi:hypothetical protein
MNAVKELGLTPKLLANKRWLSTRGRDCIQSLWKMKAFVNLTAVERDFLQLCLRAEVDLVFGKEEIASRENVLWVELNLGGFVEVHADI